MSAVAEELPTGPERPGWSLTGAELLAELDALHEAQTRLAARRLELLATLDEAGHARDLGARDTVELISLRHRLDPHAVRRDLRTARALPRHPVLARQLPGYPAPPDEADPVATGTTEGGCTADGRGGACTTGGGCRPDGACRAGDACTADGGCAAGGEAQDAGGLAMLVERRRIALAHETRLNAGQVEVMAEVLGKVPATVPRADVAVAETELVIAARTLAPRDLRRIGRGVLNALDADGPAPADTAAASEAARSAQTLWFTPGTSTSPAGTGGRVRGLRFGGFLTGEDAELFQTLVDAAAEPRKTPEGELDPRTLGQRRAEALGIVLRAAASTGGEIPPHGGIKPHLSVIIGYPDLLGAANATNLTNAANATKPGIQLSAGIAHTGGELVFGDPLPASVVRRIACDAGVIPIVLGSQSEPLDVGREQRLVTPAIRRALIARDGGCVIPGCGAPPGHCDAHHLTHWIDGGETSVDNLALVCPTHHRAIHRGVWTVTVTNGQVRITRPTWTEPTAQPP